MYSLDIHSEHRNMADTSQVGKCRLYTNFNTKKGNQNNKKTSTVSFSNHENRQAPEIAYNTRAIMVLLWILTCTIAIHKLNFFILTWHNNIFSFHVVVTKAVLRTKYHLIAANFDWGVLIKNKTKNQTWFLSLHVRNSGIWEIFARGIQNMGYKESTNPLTTGIRNPKFPNEVTGKNPESNIALDNGPDTSYNLYLRKYCGRYFFSCYLPVLPDILWCIAVKSNCRFCTTKQSVLWILQMLTVTEKLWKIMATNKEKTGI